MDWKILNEVLSNIGSIRWNKKDLLLEEKKLQSHTDGYEGVCDVRYEIYEIPKLKDMFLKVIYSTDSYGENDSIDSICFVKKIEKTVTVYEYE